MPGPPSRRGHPAHVQSLVAKTSLAPTGFPALPSKQRELVRHAFLAQRPPGVSPVSFPRPGSFRASPYLAGSPHGPGPSIRFLFVGAAIRLRLPSDPASRRTPMPSAIRFGATSVR